MSHKLSINGAIYEKRPIKGTFVDKGVQNCRRSDKNVHKTKNCLRIVKVLASAYTIITILIISGCKMLGHFYSVFFSTGRNSVWYNSSFSKLITLVEE